MVTSNWITIAIGSLTIFTSYLLAFRNGLFKKQNLHFSPSIYHKTEKNKRFVVKAVINCITLKKSNINRIRTNLHFGIENTSNYRINDTIINLAFPKKYYEGKLPALFKNPYMTLLSEGIVDNDVNISFELKKLEPHFSLGFSFGISIKASDFYTSAKKEHPFFYLIESKECLCDLFRCVITSQHLKKPIVITYNLITVLNVKPKIFFAREKKLIHEIKRNSTEDITYFEVRQSDILETIKGTNDLLISTDRQKIYMYSQKKTTLEPTLITFTEP